MKHNRPVPGRPSAGRRSTSPTGIAGSSGSGSGTVESGPPALAGLQSHGFRDVLVQASKTGTQGIEGERDDNRAPIDSEGQLFGTTVSGPATLRAAVLREPENFVTTLTEKALIYALGRGIDHRDMPTVRSIVRAAASEGYRFSSIVTGIVESDPFRSRIVLAPQVADASNTAF